MGKFGAPHVELRLQGVGDDVDEDGVERNAAILGVPLEVNVVLAATRNVVIGSSIAPRHVVFGWSIGTLAGRETCTAIFDGLVSLATANIAAAMLSSVCLEPGA